MYSTCSLIGITCLPILIIISPVLTCYIRAGVAGADITFRQAIYLTWYKCTSKAFLKSVAAIWWIRRDIPLKKLLEHQLCTGSLENVRAGFEYKMENNIDIDDSMIFIVDLAGKDMVETLKMGEPYC